MLLIIGLATPDLWKWLWDFYVYGKEFFFIMFLLFMFLCVCKPFACFCQHSTSNVFLLLCFSGVYAFHCDKHRVSIPRGELIQNVYKDDIDALNVSYIHTLSWRVWPEVCLQDWWGQKLVTGNPQPMFRVPMKRAITEEILSLTALQRKRDWWTSLYSSHRELNSIWWYLDIFIITDSVNKSTRHKNRFPPPQTISHLNNTTHPSTVHL